VNGSEVAKVKEITGGAGCEAVVDFVGEGGAIEAGIGMLRRAGTYYVIGYGGMINVPAIDMISQEINFVGNLVGTYNDLDELMTLTAQGRVALETRIYPLDAVNDAMDDLDHGKLHGRGIFVPAHRPSA
jgi:NAD+-dependent secondary alcohol dehydrogenase Adh1